MNNSHQSAAIGIDVGGTKIAGAVVLWPSGEVLFPLSTATRPERGGEAVLATTIEMIHALLASAHAQGIRVQGAGVGVAELVDAHGNVTSAQTIDWQDFPVRDRISKICPSEIESDVRAGALAEATFGAGQGLSTFAYVTVGTGISSCFVQDGRPLAGAHGNALVLASSALSTVCTACGKDLHPVLEEFASGPAIAARYGSPCEHVFEAAASGDARALHILETAGSALGVSVAFLVNILDPHAVVVGGGLGLAGGCYWEAFVTSAREHIWSPVTRTLPFLRASLGVRAGVVGAAAKIFLSHPVLQEEIQSA